MGGRNLEPKLPSVPNSQENSEMSLSRELRSPTGVVNAAKKTAFLELASRNRKD